MDGKEVYVPHVDTYVLTKDRVADEYLSDYLKIIGKYSVDATFETEYFYLRPQFYTDDYSWLEEGKCYIYDHETFIDELVWETPRINNNKLQEVPCSWVHRPFEKPQKIK